MEVNHITKLLKDSENPKLEFKSKWYCNTNKFDDRGWGEFLKDLITIANGNSGFVGQPGYLIIGVADEDPEIGKEREIFHIANNGMLSDLQKLRETTLRKLRETCSPSPANIEINFIKVEGKNLLIIEVPASIDVIKLDRDLNTRGMRFKKGTVLIRTGQDISVADPIEISSLRKEYRKVYQDNWTQVQQVIHNLPQPDYVNFVGRKEELEKLRSLLHPNDRIWTIVIDGIGGIGKSAIALEIAHYYLNEHKFIAKEERFQAIIWISAKDSVLTVEGIKTRFQVSNTLQDIYRQIAIVIGEQEINNHNFDEQILLINRVLGKARTLLIIDNLETIDDERVNAFIRELPNPTKCIVTTRHRINVADPIRLSAMPYKDAMLLIYQECEKKNIQLDDSQVELLYKRTAGVPLAVVWSIAQISYHGFGIDKVLRSLGDAKGDIARFCFENAVKHLQNKPAYKILVIIALSSRSMSRKEIGSIADLSELDRDEGLAMLERLSLINKNNSQFNLLPLVKEYVLSKIQDFIFKDLRQFIIRFSENYAPSGADALSLIEKYFSSEIVAPLKDEVTHTVVNQMWEWDGQYDEIGVGYCISALEKLSTDTALDAIKDIAMYSNVSYQTSWMYSDAIAILSHANRLTDLIDLIIFYQNLGDVTLKALKIFETEKVVQEIDRRLEVQEENKYEILKQLKDKLLS